MATKKTNTTKIQGYKIITNNLTDSFEVDFSQKRIFFNSSFYESLNEYELRFCVRWAMTARRLRTPILTDIDAPVIRWYVSNWGKGAYDEFLRKIYSTDLYHRLKFSEMIITKRKSIWRKMINFITKKN